MKLLETAVRISGDTNYAPVIIRANPNLFIKLTVTRGMLKLDMDNKVEVELIFTTMIHYIPGALYRQLNV